MATPIRDAATNFTACYNWPTVAAMVLRSRISAANSMRYAIPRRAFLRGMASYCLSEE